MRRRRKSTLQRILSPDDDDIGNGLLDGADEVAFGMFNRKGTKEKENREQITQSDVFQQLEQLSSFRKEFLSKSAALMATLKQRQIDTEELLLKNLDDVRTKGVTPSSSASGTPQKRKMTLAIKSALQKVARGQADKQVEQIAKSNVVEAQEKEPPENEAEPLPVIGVQPSPTDESSTSYVFNPTSFGSRDDENIDDVSFENESLSSNSDDDENLFDDDPLPRFIVLPESTIRVLHDVLFLIILAYEILQVGSALSLKTVIENVIKQEKQYYSFPSHEIIVFDVVITIFYVFSSIMNFRTAQLDNWELIGDMDDEVPQLMLMYLHGWFKLDVAITIPYGLLVLHWSTAGYHFLKVIKVLRLVRVPSLFRRSSPVSHRPLWVRTILFMFCWLLCVHCLACVWVGLEAGEVAGDDFNHTERYVRAIYYVVSTMTTVGYGDITPKSSRHKLFSSVLMMLGAGTYGYVTGNISKLLLNTDQLKRESDDRRTKLGAFMHFYDVPWSLQKETFAIYPMIIEREVYDLESTTGDLPLSISSKLRTFIKMKLLRELHFMKGLPEKVCLLLSEKLLAETVDAGEIIIFEGTEGSEMYVVNRGVVEVFKTVRDSYGKLKKVWLVNLRDGSFFGEFSLLKKCKRTATVRSLTPCQLFVLTKEAFEETCLVYPQLREALESQMSNRAVPEPSKEDNKQGNCCKSEQISPQEDQHDNNEPPMRVSSLQDSSKSSRENEIDTVEVDQKQKESEQMLRVVESLKSQSPLHKKALDKWVAFTRTRRVTNATEGFEAPNSYGTHALFQTRSQAGGSPQEVPPLARDSLGTLSYFQGRDSRPCSPVDFEQKDSFPKRSPFNPLSRPSNMRVSRQSVDPDANSDGVKSPVFVGEGVVPVLMGTVHVNHGSRLVQT